MQRLLFLSGLSLSQLSKEINSHQALIAISCSLSFLSFIPLPNSYRYSNISLDPSNSYVLISFACIFSASFSLIFEYVMDILKKLGLIERKSGSSVDHLYLLERWALISGYLYPTIGYFVLISVAPDHVGQYYYSLVTSQTIWQGGSILTILHSSYSKIWTFKWILWILLCATVNAISGSVGTTSTESFVISALAGFVAVISFLHVYRQMLISVWKKNWSNLSMGEYVCMSYSTLVFFMFFIQCVGPMIVTAVYGDVACIVYVNISLIVCINLSSNIQSRTIQYRKLESTEQSLATKQAFIRYLSHEMRTPINVALVGLDLHEKYLKEADLYNIECKDVLTDVKDSVGVALGTLNEVLNYEKLHSNVMTLEKTKENPLPFVLSSFSMFRMPAANAGIELVLPEAVDGVNLDYSCVEIDTHKMSQVMRNLISNAIKFTPRGGTITVTLATRGVEQTPRQRYFSFLFSTMTSRHQVVDDDWLEISVRDSGIGIAPENIGRVFNEIVQFDPNRNQGGNGSGLGLYISKGIVELHGGTVAVQSEGLGQGCTFSVLLPLCRVRADEKKVVPVVDDLEMQGLAVQAVLPSGIKPTEQLQSSRTPATILSEKVPVQSLEGMKMLVVDDSATNLKMCCKLFKKLGAEVEQATDGNIAVDMVRTMLEHHHEGQVFDLEATIEARMYDVVVMDNLMPIMCGPEACAAMRELGYKGLVIGLTGHALAEDIAKYKAHGANSVLKKPIDMAEFFEAMAEYRSLAFV